MYFIIDGDNLNVKVLNTESKTIDVWSFFELQNNLIRGKRVIGFDSSYRKEKFCGYRMFDDAPNGFFSCYKSDGQSEYEEINLSSCVESNSAFDDIKVCCNAIVSSKDYKELGYCGVKNISIWGTSCVSSLEGALHTDLMFNSFIRCVKKEMASEIRTNGRNYRSLYNLWVCFFDKIQCKESEVVDNGYLVNFLLYNYFKSINLSGYQRFNPVIGESYFKCPDELDFSIVEIDGNIYFFDDNVCMWLSKDFIERVITTDRALIKLKMSNGISGEYTVKPNRVVSVDFVDTLVVNGDLNFELDSGTNIGSLVIDCDDFINHLIIKPGVSVCVLDLCCSSNCDNESVAKLLEDISFDYLKCTARIYTDFKESGVMNLFKLCEIYNCTQDIADDFVYRLFRKRLGVDILTTKYTLMTLCNKVCNFKNFDMCSNRIKDRVLLMKSSWTEISTLLQSKVSPTSDKTIEGIYSYLEGLPCHCFTEGLASLYYDLIETKFLPRIAPDGYSVYSADIALLYLDPSCGLREFVVNEALEAAYRMESVLYKRLLSLKEEVLGIVRHDWILTTIQNWVDLDADSFEASSYDFSKLDGFGCNKDRYNAVKGYMNFYYDLHKLRECIKLLISSPYNTRKE